MEAQTGKPVRAVFVPDENGVPDFVYRYANQVTDVAEMPFEGKLWGFVVKVARDPVKRDDQYRWLLEHISQVFEAERVPAPVRMVTDRYMMA